MLRSRTSLVSLLIGSTLVFSGVSLADQILEIYGASLTSFLPTGKTKVQNVRPRPEQRGVNLDGSMRATPGIPAALAGNPFENVWGGTSALEGVRLDTGTYNPFEVDIALPAPGHSWIVGRSYNARQDDSGQFDSQGPQGVNWHQSSQPELMFFNGASDDLDVIYLVYGADRYVEFQRDGEFGVDFKSKNGAAGAFTEALGTPDIYTYTGPNGTTIKFFGGDTASNKADWQIWKITDADGNTSFVGDSSTASTAVTNGFDAGGRITTAFDSADRRFTYTYSSHDSVTRLDEVKAETKTGGTWASPSGVATVAKVNYTYYTDEVWGDIGDLKTVTITTPTSDSGVDHVKTKYFRYWEGAYNADTNPGVPHELKLVLDYEGARAYDWLDTTFDSDYAASGVSVATLKPYSLVYLEYDSSKRVNLATFNGSCGCGGAGANGTTLFTYGTNGAFSEVGGYDIEWARRTVVARADGTYLTQYFDETGQALSQIITNTNPASSPTQTWATVITRDSLGCVSEIDTPAAVSAYDQSDGTFTIRSGDGLIRTYTRASSTDVKSFVTDVKYKKGSSGTAYLEHSWTHDYTTATKTLTDVTIARPLIASDRVYSTPETSGTSGSYLTSFTYTSWGGSYPLSIEKVVTTYPTVSTGTNGSNAADTSSVHIKKDGLQDFAKSEDLEITYTAYTNGQATTRIEDADTTSLSPPTGFSSTGTRAHLSTTSTYDAQGRLRTRTHPSTRREQWTHGSLLDRKLETLHYPHSTGGGVLYGPGDMVTSNLAGKPIERAVVVIDGGLTSPFSSNDEVDETTADSIEATEVGPLGHGVTFEYEESGTHETSRLAHFAMPATWAAADPGDYDESSTTEDDMGRVIRRVDATSTIHRSTYDSLGRAYRTWIGTNDYGEVGGSVAGPNNMVKTEELEFDGNAAGGNSFLTKRTSYVQDDTTGQRVVNFSNDVRGNVLMIDNPTGPDQLFKYDNMNRQIAVGQFTSTSASNDPTSTTTNRLALSQTFLDERGRIWKSQRHKIDVSDGSDDDNLQTLTWYDATGRVIKVDGERLTKTAYDTAGRAVVQYVLSADNDASYSNADDVTGDIVLEQRQTAFDSSGRVIVQASISRYHTDEDSPTGSLDTALTSPSAFTLTGSPDVLGRIQISAMWFDAIDRVTTTANYGTNGGSNFSYPGSPASPSDTVLVTTSVFNDDGTLFQVTDPKGLITQYEYDEAGRRTKVIANWVNGTPSSATADDDQIVQYAYTDGLQTSITAYVDGSSNDQVTTYTYGVTKGTNPGDSKIASNSLLAKVKYPDAVDSSDDVVKFAYNAQGQEIWKKDQYLSTPLGGNIFETTFDTAGRETIRAVTTVGTGFDSEVRRIETAYTSLGQVETVTQFDATTSGDELDQVKYLYDSWGNITNFRQDMDDIVDSSGYYEVAYAYAKVTEGRNTIRRSSETVGGKTFTLSYISDAMMEPDNFDVASRVYSIMDGETTLVRYDCMGSGQVVGTTYDEPDVFAWQYSGSDLVDLDRFDRTIVSKWTKDLASDQNFYKVTLAYDRNSNITSADEDDNSDDGHVGFDLKYTMDNLNRLSIADEGTLSGGSITARTRKQEWTLTQTGNWSLDKLDLNGDADWGDTDEWNDTKTFNKVNEIGTRDLDTTPGTSGNNYSLTYDPAGNLTNDATDYKYEWDAFYRLRKVKTQADALVAEYRYNGLGYRIAVHADTDTDLDVDGSDLWYYSAYDEGWRMVATYRSSDDDPKERFVHHQAGDGGFGGSSYIDLVAFREKDANTDWDEESDGVLEQRIYYCQNQHADVVSLITSAGGMREMDRYSAYGVPFGLPVGDANSDGKSNSADRTQIQNWINASNHYDVRGDLDLDGDVDLDDKDTLQYTYGVVDLGRGILSASAVGNRHGWISKQMTLSANCHSKTRSFSVALGRYLSRCAVPRILGFNIALYQSDDLVDQYAPVTRPDFESASKTSVNTQPRGEGQDPPGLGGSFTCKGCMDLSWVEAVDGRLNRSGWPWDFDAKTEWKDGTCTPVWEAQGCYGEPCGTVTNVTVNAPGLCLILITGTIGGVQVSTSTPGLGRYPIFTLEGPIDCGATTKFDLTFTLTCPQVGGSMSGGLASGRLFGFYYCTRCKKGSAGQ